MDGLKARLSFDAVAYDYDDEYLTIDTDTHTININNVSRLFGVQYDGNSKLIKFRIRNKLSDIQKMQDSIVYINWIDSRGVKGQSIAINKTINNDTCEFAWKVPFDALKNSGVLHFAVSAVVTKNSSSVIDQRWSTKIASVITPDGIYIKSYTPSSEEEDRIAQIYTELSNMINKQNDNLQLQVNSLNEALGNKIDVTWNEGTYIEYFTGAVYKQAQYSCTNYINVSNIDRLFYFVKQYQDDNSGYAFMGKNWEYVSGGKIYGHEYGELEVPENAVYFAISTYKPLESYVKILNVRKNLIKECKQKMLVSKVVPTTNGYISNTGKIYSNDNYLYTDIITLRAGESIKVVSSDISGSNVSRIAKYGYKLEYVSTICTGTLANTEYTYTATEKVEYIRACVYDKSEYTIQTFTYAMLGNDIKYTSLGCYKSMGIVGDSFASGETRYGDSWHDNYWQSWGQILSRLVGNHCTNFSSGGLTTKTWLERDTAKGLTLLENSEPCDIYICALGINDTDELGTSYLGTIDDMTDNYENNPDTFYGNYGKIIGNILKKNPTATIVLSSIALHSNSYDVFSDAIKEIANKAGVVFLDTKDSDFFNSPVFNNSRKNGHPNNQTYAGMAYAYEELFNNAYPNYIDYLHEKYHGYVE